MIVAQFMSFIWVSLSRKRDQDKEFSVASSSQQTAGRLIASWVLNFRLFLCLAQSLITLSKVNGIDFPDHTSVYEGIAEKEVCKFILF
jgi:hypothetical protein